MTITIEVKSPIVTDISGTSKAGKPYHIRKQAAYAFTYDQTGKVNDYPERIEFSLADGQEPFAPGRYTLHPSSFFVGDFHQLSIGRPVLHPLKAA